MALAWEQVIVHALDPVALGRWWAEALGWVVVYSDDDEFEIRPEPDRQPAVDFVRVDEPKQGKSRLHLDFRPDDQDAEVARLLALGAQRVDIGQGEQSWVVLADPEGNEFCVLAGARQLNDPLKLQVVPGSSTNVTVSSPHLTISTRTDAHQQHMQKVRSRAR